MIELRSYQDEALSSLMNYWNDGGGNPLVDLATGTGKSVVIATLARRLIEAYPNMRVLMLVHVRELVEQNAKAILRAWPTAPLGINSAGLGRRDKRSQILCASIQSVANEDASTLGERHLVIVDEAHLIPKSGNGMYRKLLGKLREAVPDLRVVGFTATPYRLDSGRLDDGDDAFFDDVVFTYGIAQGVDDGFLSPLVSRATGQVIDVSNVQRRGGEFVAGALEAAANQDAITQAACSEIIAKGSERNSWLVFCAGVAHALAVRDAMRQRGIQAECVTGETPKGDRDRIIAAFRDGRLRCLTNANVLTTGFDAPCLDLIAMLRPTLSTSLYVQMLGRGTRLAPGKENCIAEGQRVLTDVGLVPIELVKTHMKVWDGVEFVTHCGIVFRGEQEVISYAGLVATPDHKVWTKEGWSSFGDCALACTAIAITGNGRMPVREAESRFRGGSAKEGKRASACSGRMHDLWRAFVQRFDLAEIWNRWMPKMWQPAICAEVAGYAGNIGETALHKSERFFIRTIWCARHTVSVCQPNCDGSLGSGEFRTTKGLRNRPHRQQQPLCSWKSLLFDRVAELSSYTKAHVERAIAFIPRTVSSRSLCRCNPAANDWRRSEVQGNKREISQPAVYKAKRRVWDILNAGPLHRFTVEGLLVSNCLVLDFAENVRRFGPVDAVEVRGTKGGSGEGKVTVETVRAKACPHCETLVSVRVYTCTHCGHEWPKPADPKHNARADSDVAVMSSEMKDRWLPVQSVTAYPHRKENSPTSMRVEYQSGFQIYKEWVTIEHPGFAGAKASKWWRTIIGTDAPKTVAEGLTRIAHEQAIKAVTIQRDGKYWRVSGYRVRRPDGRMIDIGADMKVAPSPLQIVKVAS